MMCFRRNFLRRGEEKDGLLEQQGNGEKKPSDEREGFIEVLEAYDLSDVADGIRKMGVRNTRHLLEVEDDDIDQSDLSIIDKKRLRKLVKARKGTATINGFPPNGSGVASRKESPPESCRPRKVINHPHPPLSWRLVLIFSSLSRAQ